PAARVRHPLSLHDALPISQIAVRVILGGEQDARQPPVGLGHQPAFFQGGGGQYLEALLLQSLEQFSQLLAGDVVAIDIEIDDQKDRKSTRLNSSHVKSSYA